MQIPVYHCVLQYIERIRGAALMHHLSGKLFALICIERRRRNSTWLSTVWEIQE